MIMPARPSVDFLKVSFHQVESPFGPGPRDTAPHLSLHVHAPPACRHLWLSPVEKVTKQGLQNHSLSIWLATDSSVSWSREAGPGKD